MIKKYKKLISSILAIAICGAMSATCTEIPPILSELLPPLESGVSDSSENSVSESDSLSQATSESASNSSSGETLVSGELTIHFPFLGNQTSGDCTLIKTGDTEILIDAGSTTTSAGTIVPYINRFCTDGILEYVIATHGDQDHIAAFVGSSSYDGIFESFECETIIDFPKTTKTTEIYKDYVALRDREVEAGAKHYTALECWNNENGAKRSYTLGNDITMDILYQKYYVETTSTENNYSVCLMITQGENHFLFTGDLESSGEKSLVQSNNLPKCTLYKAGHHGSKTSSTVELISVIQPEIVVACCCCGDKHGFPHQEFINNIAKYTDKLYVPSMVSGNSYKLLNGSIVITSNKDGVSVDGSNNETLFKDTEWFKENRTMPETWKN